MIFRRIVSAWLVLAATGVFATNLRFTNVTVQAGITHALTIPPRTVTTQNTTDFPWMMGGAVAEDFNGDGRIDLFFGQGDASSNLLYMNVGGGVFTNEATLRGVDLSTNTMGVAAADYDNDGDIDIVTTEVLGPPHLFTNFGAGFFGSVELPGPTNMTDSEWKRFTSVSFGDYNNDGALEMTCGQWFTANRDSLFFYTNHAGVLDFWLPFDLATVTNGQVFSPCFADFNGDRLSDLPSVNDFTNSQLFLNTGSNSFRVVTQSARVGTDMNGMGVAIGDYDNDGDLDWFVSSITDTNPPAEGKWGINGNRLYRNDGKGVFDDATSEAGVRDGNWGWGAAFGDLDNDGDLDLVQGNGYPLVRLANGSYLTKFAGQPARLFENRGDGTFTNVAAEAGADDSGQNRAVILFDMENDGDLDILIVNNQVQSFVGTNYITNAAPPTLLRNDTPATNKWIDVKLAGTPPFHRNGIGSRAWITAGGQRQMRELNASTGYLGHGPNRIAHFGLGTNATVAEVRAEWVNGAAVIMENVNPNQTIVLPSPVATTSASRVHAGVAVTASASGLGATPRSWVIEGQTNADPVTRRFYHPGVHEFRLNIYATNGTTLLRSELHRVTVDSTVVSAVTALTNDLWQVQWDAISGGVYRVQVTPTFPGGAWQNVSGLTTATAAGPQLRTVTNATANPVWRVLEFVP